MKKKIISTIFIAALLLSTGIAFADVDPAYVEDIVYPGESIQIEKTVITPDIPLKLDLLLLEDETGSFYDDIDTMNGVEPDHSDGLAYHLWDGIALEVVDFQAGVAGFRDFARQPWGQSLDWVYKLHIDMTTSKSTWLAGIATLSAGGGGDQPEAQLPALMSAANGAAWDSNGNGDYLDPMDTVADQDPTWRNDATKVIVLVTDAPYHKEGETPTYPGPSYADTITALNAEGIHVIILATSEVLADYTTLAADTGGVVKLLADDSANIVEAVLDALDEVLTDVWYEVDCPDGLTVTLDPVMYEDYPGGSTLLFNEIISVSEDAFGEYSATVTFYANTWPHEGAVIGVEEIKITVPGIAVGGALVPFDKLSIAASFVSNNYVAGVLIAAIAVAVTWISRNNH